MYRWRSLTEAQRHEVREYRFRHKLPRHSPPHYRSESGLYLITAACFEHEHHIGLNVVRMASFEQSLCDVIDSQCESRYAWVVLPNHYHALLKTADIRASLKSLGRLHGRTSHQWNGEEGTRGRQVWFRAAETGIKSERHFWASFLYVLHNPVKHGYCDRWQDWPFSNAAHWVETHGREEAARLWNEFPIDDFGSDWDPPDL